MDKKDLDNLRARTDAKLRYAEIHLKELENRENRGGKAGDDFAQSHQESFLYHLFGAKEAFIRELSKYYGCVPGLQDVTPGKLKNELSQKGKQSPELAALKTLEDDPTSWFYRAKGMRDDSTHLSGIPKAYHYGGTNQGQVSLISLKSGLDTGMHFIDEFRSWHEAMNALLDQLRETAIQANQPNAGPQPKP